MSQDEKQKIEGCGWNWYNNILRGGGWQTKCSEWIEIKSSKCRKMTVGNIFFLFSYSRCIKNL